MSGERVRGSNHVTSTATALCHHHETVAPIVLPSFLPSSHLISQCIQTPLASPVYADIQCHTPPPCLGRATGAPPPPPPHPPSTNPKTDPDLDSNHPNP